jgi:glycerol kinase
VRPANSEITAFGAACLAGLAAGYWNDLAEITALWRPERVYEPLRSSDCMQEMRRRWTRALTRAKGWEKGE